MTKQMAELVLQDVDTSEGLKSMRVFKFSKEDKQRLSEEAKKFKELGVALPSDFHALQDFDREPIALEEKFTFDDDTLSSLERMLKWGTPIPDRKIVVKVRLVSPEEKQLNQTLWPGGFLRELVAFERERLAFLRIKDSLLDNPKFRGKFVAIYKGNIVGQDEDNRKLARRVYSRYGYVPIYIDKIERERRVIEMPSPEGL